MPVTYPRDVERGIHYIPSVDMTYPRDASHACRLWFTSVSPKRAIASPLWPTPALERQGPKDTIGKIATHMIYISGRQWHIPTDIVVIVRFGSLVCILNQTQAKLASAPALCTKCWWRVRRKEAIQIPARLLCWLLPWPQSYHLATNAAPGTHVIGFR